MTDSNPDGVPLCKGVDEFGIPIDFPKTAEGSWMKLTPTFEYFVITTRDPPPPLKHGQRFCKRRPREGIRPLTYYTEYETLRKQTVNVINELEARKAVIAQELKDLLERRADTRGLRGEPMFSTPEKYLEYSGERGKIIREKIIPLGHEIRRQWEIVADLDTKYAGAP